MNDDIKIKFKGQDYDVHYCPEDNQLVIGIKKQKNKITNMAEDLQKIYHLNEYLRCEGFFPQYFQS